MVKEFWGNADAATLEEEAGLYGQLILGTPEVSGYSWACCQQSSQPLRVRQYSVLYTGLHSVEPLMASSSVVNNWKCWMSWAMGMGRDPLQEGKLLRHSANTISLLGLY